MKIYPRHSVFSNALRVIAALLFAVLFALPLQAAHIVGGEITYRCIGTGRYLFTMKIYRDCFGGGADFDSGPNGAFPGTMTIYQGNSQTPLLTFEIAPPEITNIEPNLSNPCLVAPPNVCVEEGVYTFELSLPVINDSYHIMYQRCCRNQTITNIANPGNVGATYYMELTALAQQVCNNSPTFNDFPPIVICAGEDINFDHSATDPDGDQLVYEFCTPFVGGGPNEQNATAPGGVAPDPDLPPPYTSVPYIVPYSFNAPLGANPPITISGNTGRINGVPNIIGQFVVGVCVKEFRNGELLSVVRRDFQFNVAECDPLVKAQIEADEVVVQAGPDLYIVNACGEANVFFDNTSFARQNIQSQQWVFDFLSEPVTTFDATIDFPGLGTYDGMLLLNPGLNCNDTAFIRVNVFPGVTADFEVEFDTCISDPVIFTDLSVSEAGPDALVEWNWDFGDGTTSSEQNPSHLYQVPGNLNVALEVRDINNCTSRKEMAIEYFPVPKVVVVAPSEVDACQPATILFDNLSFPIDESYDIRWDFGDGGFSDQISPLHTYEDVGVYTVSLEITSPLGCFTDTVFQDLVTVRPSPMAGFTFTPGSVSNIEPTVTFTDQSQNAVRWEWDFSGLGSSTLPNPVFTFPDTGLMEVTQVVFHASGCTDTARALIDVRPEVRYFLPNAFTPNGDGHNDRFFGQGVLKGATDFQLTIWNRYGEKLFETSDPEIGWNGRKNNTGRLAPPGVYVVVVNYRGPRGEKVELRGFVTLIR